jgi:hypothetical protein
MAGYIEEPLVGDNGVFDGFPEDYAMAQRHDLEKKHGCRLQFVCVRMGGSVWPKGDPRFEMEQTVSVWKRA